MEVSDVAGMRTTAVRKGINMLLWINIFSHQWCLCGFSLYCRRAKTKPDITA
jgi:hypothetical protein